MFIHGVSGISQGSEPLWRIDIYHDNMEKMMRWVSYEEAKAFYREHGSAILLAVAAVVFFVSLYYVLDTYPPKDDVLNFYKQAEMIKDGMVPYRDFVFEFPPFALLFFLIPSMFTSELDVYAQIFGVMVTLISLICLFYVLRISERMGVNRAVVTFVFIALMLLYYKELVVKFDTIPMMLTVMAIYYFQRGNRYAAYGLAMVGALVKIYPIFLVVLFLILDLVDRHDSRRVRVLRGFCACVAVGLVSLVPLLVAGASFGDVMSFLTFHTERGFQVESVLCKVGHHNRSCIGVEDHRGKPMCNPIAQSEYLNQAGTQLNIAVGLCVGHDSLFFQHSKAPVTVLIAKDHRYDNCPARFFDAQSAL